MSDIETLSETLENVANALNEMPQDVRHAIGTIVTYNHELRKLGKTPLVTLSWDHIVYSSRNAPKDPQS